MPLSGTHSERTFVRSWLPLALADAVLIGAATAIGLLAGCRTTGMMPGHRERPVASASNRLDREAIAPAHCEQTGDERPTVHSEDVDPLSTVIYRADKQVELTGAQLPISTDSTARDSADSSVVPTLSLENAINLALERNPNLATVRASGPVAHAAFHVAETYPWNPQFQTQVLPYSRDRNGTDGAVSQQHVVVQTFELGGQQRFREGAAAANWRQVSGTIRQAELMTTAQTATLYFAVLYQRELRDISQALADANERLVGVMQRRQNAGQANQSDVELARLQSQSSRRQQALAEASLQTASMNLRNQLNLSASAPLELTHEWLNWRWKSIADITSGALTSTCNPCIDKIQLENADGSVALAMPENEAMLRRVVVDRPDVAAARAGVAMAMQNLSLAKAMKRPNLQTGPMWQRDQSATVFWGVQAQMDIPIVNTGQTLVAQRFAELRQQQITAEQLENQAVLEARAAMQRYERARLLVEESYEEFARPTSDSMRPFEEQFKAGQITLLQVFAARAAIVQSRQSYLDLVNELAVAAAGVTQATGLLPQLLVSDGQPLPGPIEKLPKP